QAKHKIYATALSPKPLSSIGGEFDLLRYTHLLETFAWFSPGHGYSLQVTFLGLFAILMGDNEPLKRQAIESLESGGLLAFGVCAADVGEFEVKNHPVPPSDIIAQGRDAWDALFGTVTLGKFFLGFASIGICERAFAEALAHVKTRILYNKPVLEMPHIRDKVNQAYVRLTAMKLFAYRALDYVHSASESDRRYLLFTAVQKARVSTEGVKALNLLSE